MCQLLASQIPRFPDSQTVTCASFLHHRDEEEEESRDEEDEEEEAEEAEEEETEKMADADLIEMKTLRSTTSTHDDWLPHVRPVRRSRAVATTGPCGAADLLLRASLRHVPKLLPTNQNACPASRARGAQIPAPRREHDGR